VRRGLAIASAVVICAPPAPLAAQARWEVLVGATGAREIVRSRTRGDTTERLSGTVFSGVATATRDRFALRLGYGQGRVTPDTGSGILARPVAEGELLVGYRARPWLTLWAGPHARTYYGTALGDQRWLFWSARASARGGLFPGRVESFAELWQSFTGSAGPPSGASATGRGAEVGLYVRLTTRPFWGRVAYRVEQGRLGNGRRETAEALTLTVGYVPFPRPSKP
jgi:hypothetical protein